MRTSRISYNNSNQNQSICLLTSHNIIKISINQLNINNNNLIRYTLNGLPNASPGKVSWTNGVCTTRYLIQYGNSLFNLHFIDYNNDIYPHQVRIFYPDHGILNDIHNILIPLDYNIGLVEYTMDMHTSATRPVFDAIRLTFRLKHSSRSRPVPKEYGTSSYVGNPRETQSKGARMYICGDEADGHVSARQNYVRLEYVAKTRLLKDNGMRQIPGLLQSNNLLLKKQIEFKTLNMDKLYRTYKKRLRDKIVSASDLLKIKGKLAHLQSKGHCGSIDKFLTHNLTDTLFEYHPFHDFFQRLLPRLDFAGKSSVTFDPELLTDPQYLYKLV